ncbi:39S ribosomal protein L33, mitochondrial [Anastrepha obliqua]|nr:39S ribosomal protein L33, mitochondrial [Anastrepha obliqua]
MPLCTADFDTRSKQRKGTFICRGVAQFYYFPICVGFYKMRLTEVLFKKVKSKRIMVLMESVVSGHQFNMFRDRLADKLELLRFDPYIQKECIYRERKRIRSA